MRTFVQKPKTPRHAEPAESTAAAQPHLRQNRDANPILHLQRTVGNQAVQRLLQPDTEKPGKNRSNSFAQELSQKPLHADAGRQPISTGAAPAKMIARQSPPKAGSEIVDFEVYTGPTDHPKWIDRSITAAGYTIWEDGFTIYVEGMPVGAQYPGIHIPGSHIDFSVEKAVPINHKIYDSHAEAIAAVAAAPRTTGPAPFAYYWGAGGRVVVPTLICPGSAPRTAEVMLGARKMYAEYVKGEVTGIALGMVIFKALGSAYAKAVSGGKTSAPPGTSPSSQASPGPKTAPPSTETSSGPKVVPPSTETSTGPKTLPPSTQTGTGPNVVPPSTETSTGPKVAPPSTTTSTAPKAPGEAPAKPPTPSLETDPRAELVWITESSKLYYRQGRPLYGMTKGRYITLGEAEAAGYRESKMDPDVEKGIAQHSQETKLMRPQKSVSLGEGWELRWVDETVGGTRRPDAVYVKAPQGGQRGRVVVIDTYTGEAEPFEHLQKGWSYRMEKMIKALLDQGYEYGYAPAVRNPSSLH